MHKMYNIQLLHVVRETVICALIKLKNLDFNVEDRVTDKVKL